MKREKNKMALWNKNFLIPNKDPKQKLSKLRLLWKSYKFSLPITCSKKYIIVAGQYVDHVHTFKQFIVKVGFFFFLYKMTTRFLWVQNQ